MLDVHFHIKFRYCQPTNRLVNQYAELGLPISPGSIAGGLKILKNLFEPVYNALYTRQMTEDRFHNDESSWKAYYFISHFQIFHPNLSLKGPEYGGRKAL